MNEHIRQDIERYRQAMQAAYGRHYSEQVHVRHVCGGTIAIRFPKGGQVIVEHERLHALSDYLFAQATKR